MRALTKYKKIKVANHKQFLNTKYNLILLYKIKNQFQHAMKYFELIVQNYIKILNSNHWKMIEISQQLIKYKNNWKTYHFLFIDNKFCLMFFIVIQFILSFYVVEKSLRVADKTNESTQTKKQNKTTNLSYLEIMWLCN